MQPSTKYQKISPGKILSATLACSTLIFKVLVLYGSSCNSFEETEAVAGFSYIPLPLYGHARAESINGLSSMLDKRANYGCYGVMLEVCDSVADAHF